MEFFYMNTTEISFQNMYSFLWEKLFCPETNLFYDRIGIGDDRFADLPCPEEIAKQFPNPNGWGTGMEDSSINGGHMLLTLSRLQALTGQDFSEECGKILAGIRLCESVHGRNGFLVRSVSHVDQKSCYFNSSRDQITMVVAGLYDVYKRIPTLPEAQRELIRTILREIAQYCRQTVTPENHYSYLRLDGGKALVSDLWDCDVHEMLRLPMIYAAAGEICEEEQFRLAALQYMEKGLQVSEKFAKEKYYWDFCLIQMQLSLDVLHQCDFLAVYHERIGRLMDNVGFAANREFCNVLTRCENYTGDWNVYNPDWRTLPMRVTAMTLKETPHNAVFDSYTYLNPVYIPEFAVIVEYQRGLGNYLTAALLAKSLSVAKEDYERFLAFLNRQDFSACTHAGPFSLLHAFALGKELF